MGSCPLSVGWKISLISLGRYTISGQSDIETDSSSRCGSFRIRFQINYHSSEKYANFIHRQSATDYKVQGWKVKKVKKYLLMVWKLQQLTLLLHHRPDSALHWLDLCTHGGEECGDMTEMTPKIVSCVAVQSFMTLSLQLDLVLNDMAATVSHNLFNQCAVILHTVTQRCGQNSYSTPNYNIYARFCMTPVTAKVNFIERLSVLYFF